MSENIFTFIEAEPFWMRFAVAVQDARREFAADPKGFLTDLFRHDPLQSCRKQFLRKGAAVAMIFWLSMSIAYIGWIFWKPLAPVVEAEATQKIYDVTALAEPLNLPKKAERAGGGGGGGNHELTPPSKGRIPPASLRPSIVAPTTHPPAIKNPSLPVIPTVLVDPSLIAKQPTDIPLGLPTGIAGPPSDGPGSNGGIGTNRGGGVGPGDGPGVGPGHHGGIGGGDPHNGGNPDPDHVYSPTEAKNPQILGKEKPKYTEDARRDKIMGVVVLSAVFRRNGTISDIKVVRGLGYGLDEEAITAAAKIRFIPGSKDGQSVNVRARLEFTFSLL